MKISIVVPAYNEAQRILPSLERIMAYLDAHHPSYDILVVDDGSTDGTAAAIRARFADRPQLRILSYGPNRGKGYAVRYAALRADGDLVLFSDADLSTPIEEVEKLLPLIQDGFDLVIGSRALKDSDIRERQPFYRDRAGKLFNVLVRLLVVKQFHDTQCGFKIFRREPMLPILQRLQIDGFAFDVEMIALAEAAGLRVAEVGVVWINSPASMVRLWPAMRAFADLVQIRRRARRVRFEGAPAHAAGGRGFGR
jgi:dolichyl-phosphate beta-glucosyltransferase